MNKNFQSSYPLKQHKIYSKTLKSSVFEEEVKKFELFYQLSLLANFRAPQVISSNKKNCTIHFEHIDDIYSIRELYILFLKQTSPEKEKKIISIFRDCGKALAQIHQKLSLPTKCPWNLEEKYKNVFHHFLTADEMCELERTPQAFLHSDFGFSNVLLQKTSEELVIIDCSPNYHTTFFCHEKGSIYIDISNFLSCLDGLIRVNPRQYFCLNWPDRCILKEAFLDGYQKQSLQTLDYSFLSKITKATSMCYFQKKYSYLKAIAAYAVLYSPWKNKSLF